MYFRIENTSVGGLSPAFSTAPAIYSHDSDLALLEDSCLAAASLSFLVPDAFLRMNTPIRMSAIVLFNQQRVRDRQKREQLAEAFRKADKNGDGRLSADEIHGIYLAHGVDVTREDVQKIVEAADKDGTGLLTEKEFVNSQAVGDVS